jgi:hypothetical protein
MRIPLEPMGLRPALKLGARLGRASAKVVHHRAFGFKARSGQPKLFEAVAA